MHRDVRIMHEVTNSDLYLRMRVPCEMLDMDADQGLKANLLKFWNANQIEQTFNFGINFNFTVEELFAKDAKPIPDFFLRGFSTKVDINLWDGFLKLLLDSFRDMKLESEEKEDRAMLHRNIIMPLMPMYIFQLNGSLETKINQQGVERMFNLPEVK